MSIVEKIERKIDNDVPVESIKTDLKRVVNELLPLRASEYKTENYCRDYLYTDDKKPIELLPGAIDGLMAPAFRKELLSVIRDDKDTFGYLYYLLSSEYNSNYPMGNIDPIRDNIPDKEKILAALEKEKIAQQQIIVKHEDTAKQEAIKILRSYDKAWKIIEAAQEKGFFDENFTFPETTSHEQLGIFAHEFCKKMNQHPFIQNGKTNFSLFDRLFGLTKGTLGKAYRNGEKEEFGKDTGNAKEGKYGAKYKRANLVFNFFRILKV
ncbi:MAG: hypothetical protein WC395_05805 [Bacteroidales bacterium]|jgi:hypothetical protein